MEKRWKKGWENDEREKKYVKGKRYTRTYVHLERSIPTEMQYLFTCVNTSVPGWPAVKFEKCIAPGNSRNARPVSRLSDLACAWISASFLISRNRCASDSPLRPIESQTLMSCLNDYSTPLSSRLCFSVFVKERVKNDDCCACLRTRSLEGRETVVSACPRCEVGEVETFRSQGDAEMAIFETSASLENPRSSYLLPLPRDIGDRGPSCPRLPAPSSCRPRQTGCTLWALCPVA